MWNDDSNAPGAAVARMVCDQEDFAPARHTPNTAAYTVPGTGRFCVTQYGQDRRLNSDIQEGDLDSFAFANMRSLPMTFVHKMMHFDGINAAIIERTVDPANGAYNCFMLDNDEKITNAQKSAWFAGEAYWSRQFNMQFSDPTPGIQLKRAIPAITDSRTVGEDQAPRANLVETSPAFSSIPASYGGGSNPFKQGEGSSAINTFCSDTNYNNLAIVPKMSSGNSKTSSGQTKTLDVKDVGMANNRNTSLCNKPMTSGGCAKIKPGTPPKND